MQLPLPAYLVGRIDAAKTLASFLKKSGFPNQEMIADLTSITTLEALRETYDRLRSTRGLDGFIEDTIRRVHTSVDFDTHVQSASVRASGARVPRLRSLLPEPPSTEDMRTQTVAAFAKACTANPPETYPALLDFYFYSTAFSEVAPQNLRNAWTKSVFAPYPDVVLQLLDARDTLPPEFVAKLVLAGCEYFTTNRYFERTYELCTYRLTKLAHITDNRPAALDYMWYAAFRIGKIDEALAALDEWIALKPTQKRPLVYRALVTSVTDPAAAMDELEDAGADLGRSTVGGNVLFAEYALRDGKTRLAEKAIRNAIYEAEQAKTAVSSDYLIALHNLFIRKARPSRVLDDLFNRSSVQLDWTSFGMDSVRDVSPDKPASRGHVAVVMTAYQAESYLERAIQGVLEQSHEDLRLIVVDDCSADRTADICKAVEDPRLTYLRTPRNMGTYAAKNIGIRLALQEGVEFITLCDSDDFWLRNHVTEHLSAMHEQPDAMCSTSQWMRVQDDGSIECGLRGRYIETCPHSTFLRREAFEATGLFDAVRFGADREFLNRVALHFGKASLININKVLTLGRRHGASLTTSGAGAISEFNESPVRLKYWKNWNEWHVTELRQGSRPRLDGDPDAAERPFMAPDEMAV